MIGEGVRVTSATVTRTTIHPRRPQPTSQLVFSLRRLLFLYQFIPLPTLDSPASYADNPSSYHTNSNFLAISLGTYLHSERRRNRQQHTLN